MNTSKNIIGRNNKTPVYKSQVNQTVSNPIYKEIDARLAKAGVSTKDRIIISGLFLKLHSEHLGKAIVRSIPHLPLKRGSSREVGKIFGYSHTKVNDWINLYGPEILIEKLRGGDK